MAVFVVTMIVTFIRNIKNVHIVLMKMMSIVVGVCINSSILPSKSAISENEACGFTSIVIYAVW